VQRKEKGGEPLNISDGERAKKMLCSGHRETCQMGKLGTFDLDVTKRNKKPRWEQKKPTENYDGGEVGFEPPARPTHRTKGVQKGVGCPERIVDWGRKGKTRVSKEQEGRGECALERIGGQGLAICGSAISWEAQVGCGGKGPGTAETL